MQERDESAFRVYYEDTDAGGVVQHAAYVRFLERARTEKFAALGLGTTRFGDKGEVVICRAVCRWNISLSGVFWMTCLGLPPFPLKSVHHPAFFSQKILCGDKEAITAEVLVVCVRQKPFAAGENAGTFGKCVEDGLANGIKPSFFAGRYSFSKRASSLLGDGVMLPHFTDGGNDMNIMSARPPD